MHRATSQANSGCSLQFSPTTSPVAFSKPRNIANRCSNSDGLDTLDLSDELEVHLFSYATKPGRRRTGQQRSALVTTAGSIFNFATNDASLCISLNDTYHDPVTVLRRRVPERCVYVRQNGNECEKALLNNLAAIRLTNFHLWMRDGTAWIWLTTMRATSRCAAYRFRAADAFP